MQRGKKTLVFCVAGNALLMEEPYLQLPLERCDGSSAVLVEVGSSFCHKETERVFKESDFLSCCKGTRQLTHLS